MPNYKPGTRVVVADGPWPSPRIPGHYGHVVETRREMTHPQFRRAGVRVQITGHVDGHPPDQMPEWFYSCELEAAD